MLVKGSLFGVVKAEGMGYYHSRKGDIEEAFFEKKGSSRFFFFFYRKLRFGPRYKRKKS